MLQPYHILQFPYPAELASYFTKKLSLWSLRPQLIPCSIHLHPPPPSTHTSLSIPTFIRTCSSQVSKVKVYIFLFKAPSFCALDFSACCLFQGYTLFWYFHALFSLACSSYPRDMFMGLAVLNEQSNNNSHCPPHTFPVLFPSLLSHSPFWLSQLPLKKRWLLLPITLQHSNFLQLGSAEISFGGKYYQQLSGNQVQWSCFASYPNKSPCSIEHYWHFLAALYSNVVSLSSPTSVHSFFISW